MASAPNAMPIAMARTESVNSSREPVRATWPSKAGTTRGPSSMAMAVKAAKDIGAPVKLAGFIRFGLGEGIQKEVTDFAAEVAAPQRVGQHRGGLGDRRVVLGGEGLGELAQLPGVAALVLEASVLQRADALGELPLLHVDLPPQGEDGGDDAAPGLSSAAGGPDCL